MKISFSAKNDLPTMFYIRKTKRQCFDTVGWPTQFTNTAIVKLPLHNAKPFKTRWKVL